jgi:hypothetical protein
MTQRPAGSRSGAEMHDTIETTALTGHAPTPATSGGVEKLCCSCGKSVSGQKRFKDAQGRYWCYDCGVEDHVRKHPEDGIACASCNGKFAPSQLEEIDDEVYCHTCAGKVKQQKKREQARIHAAEEEAKAQAKRHKLMLIGAASLAVIGLVVALIVVL